MAQTDGLQRGQLPDSGSQQQSRTQQVARRCHHCAEKLYTPERPLRGDRSQTECAPHDQISADERSRGRAEPMRRGWRSGGLGAGKRPARYRSVQKHHGRRARQHHRDHHEPPHGKHESRVSGRPCDRWHRHACHAPCTRTGSFHARLRRNGRGHLVGIHARACSGQEVQPGHCRHRHQSERDYLPIPTQHGLEHVRKTHGPLLRIAEKARLARSVQTSIERRLIHRATPSAANVRGPGHLD